MRTAPQRSARGSPRLTRRRRSLLHFCAAPSDAHPDFGLNFMPEGPHTPDADMIDATEIGRLLTLTVTTVHKLMSQGDLSSSIDATGQRRAARTDVLAWRDQRETQRASLRELVRMSEEHESYALPRLPNAPDVRNADAEYPQVTRQFCGVASHSTG